MNCVFVKKVYKVGGSHKRVEERSGKDLTGLLGANHIPSASALAMRASQARDVPSRDKPGLSDKKNKNLLRSQIGRRGNGYNKFQ